MSGAKSMTALRDGRTSFATLAGRHRTLLSIQSGMPERTCETLDLAAISEYSSEQNAATFH
jgi:hypothetical protein